MRAIIERDHDFGGKVTYFHLNEERANNPASGSIEVSHERKDVNVNVQIGRVTPEDARGWGQLILEAAAFAKGLEG